ncbi:HEPN/Toprim-associated domain-containing protein [Micromonospora haikouensis]|uniref:HEPN/Toprim-associated domain-containing protein n=1 Tax=Micromonospora haikouensis TaxID=686309 RepID=UPI00368E5688
MASYASIFLNDKEVFSYRNEVHSEVNYFFSPSDRVEIVGQEAIKYAHGYFALEDYDEDELEALEVIAYQASAEVVRDRLTVLGYGMKIVEDVFVEMRQILLESSQRTVEYLAEMESDSDHQVYVQQSKQSLRYYQELTFPQWLEDVKTHLSEKAGMEVPDQRDLGVLDLFESMDQRVVMRLLSEVAAPGDIFTLDLTELSEGGWLDGDISVITGPDIDGKPNAGPPIVITEGRFDARVLQESIKLLKPHLAGYVRFLDYDVGNEGGAAAAVRMVKSFAAAGIANPVLALFDNDSAAREAVLGFGTINLPRHFRIMHYPDLGFASSYPTLGPQGSVDMDVNGLAGSIELYLGRDVLSREDGSLLPVQWKGYMGKIKAYQGEILDKSAVQKAFERKLDTANKTPGALAAQDWSGILSIIDALMDALSRSFD